jgi:hypothetical protein
MARDDHCPFQPQRVQAICQCGQVRQGAPCPELSTKSPRFYVRIKPEKAQIVVKGADDRDLRIETTLIDENVDEVRLKKGAHVEVTVTARAEQ